MMGRPTSHDVPCSMVGPCWDGTDVCVPGTGLMRLDRDETSAGTEKLSLVTYNLLRTYMYACILNL